MRIVIRLKKMRKRTLDMLAWLTGLLLCACSMQEGVEPQGKELGVGDRMPAFEVELFIPDSLDWRRVGECNFRFSSSTSLRGKHIYLVFFNTECQDCQRELPKLQRLYETIRGDSARAFLAISREEGKEQIEAYWRQKGLTLPFSPQPNRSVYNLFATSGIPQYYEVDESGTIVVHE